MKTYKDLKFKNKRRGTGLHARMFFKNGYGISVLRAWRMYSFRTDKVYETYTNNDDEWEVGILYGTAGDNCLCYSTPIADDVIPNCKQEDVERIMKELQELPNPIFP